MLVFGVQSSRVASLSLSPSLNIRATLAEAICPLLPIPEPACKISVVKFALDYSHPCTRDPVCQRNRVPVAVLVSRRCRAYRARHPSTALCHAVLRLRRRRRDDDGAAVLLVSCSLMPRNGVVWTRSRFTLLVLGRRLGEQSIDGCLVATF
jgi:hypothetical protein